MSTVISVEHLSKQYDLGVVGTGSLIRDFERWLARMRKQPDPYAVIGQEHHQKKAGNSILALDNVSFDVQQGETLGIIGKNGAGKSTLLKILSRVTAPTSGVVKIKGRIGSLLEVGTGFHPELTGRENVYLNGAILGMKKDEVTRKFDEIVSFSGVEKFIYTPVKRYSSGMYVRLAFAVAAHLDPEILIVDEVLAVGDAEFQKKCLGKMGDVAKEGRTVLFVSHNMASIERLCNNGILLRNGMLIKYSNVREIISTYLSDLPESHIHSSYENHTIFINDNYQSESYAITKIELFDSSGLPISRISTWDTVDLKISFFSKKPIENASVALQIFDKYNNSLLLLSAQPDSNINLDLKQGEGSIHCLIKDFPLSAGIYKLGCGLAIPNKTWLCWESDLAWFTVHEKDVFESNFPPSQSRALFAVNHQWFFENANY